MITAGTPESCWVALSGLPPLDIPWRPRAVVVAPHPDDEVLAAGGLMQRLAGADVALTVVGVTDGEASHPDSPTLTSDRLAALRAEERAAALDALGLAGVGVVRLRLADGHVDEDGPQMATALASLLSPDVLCVAPWSGDGHPDHDASGVVAARVATAVGAPLLRYLIWTWHWAVAGDRRVPWPRAGRLLLTPGEQRRKERAIAAFTSQIAALSPAVGDETILPDAVLAHFRRPFEVFLR